jgi:hypothetical protein
MTDPTPTHREMYPAAEAVFKATKFYRVGEGVGVAHSTDWISRTA